MFDRIRYEWRCQVFVAMRRLVYETARGEIDLPLLHEMVDAMMRKKGVMVIMKDDGGGEIYKS